MSRHLTAPVLCVAFAACAEPEIEWGDPDLIDPDQMAIHGGSLPTEWYHDAVFTISTFNLPRKNYFCSGVLIAPDVIMTAAHCLDEAGAGGAFNTVETTDIKVGFGAKGGTATYFKVSKVEIEPGYDRLGFGINDVGLIRTNQDMEVKNGITSVPVLPVAEELVDPGDIGTTINMAGFGENNTPEGPGTKLQIDLPIDDLNSQTLEVAQAGGGICFGDSGGPDFIDRNGTIYVAGIHSFGINIVPDCSGANSIGVSMQASEFEAFIAAF